MSTGQPEKTSKKTDKLIGQSIAGKYKIIKKIGEGGMGSVYIAKQEPIDRNVAIKVLLGKLAEDEVAVKRFEQEARAISKMQHPNTVTIYDFGRTAEDDGDRLYIVMEYLKGRTLTQVLRADGVLLGPRAARIIRQVCASLADAHAAGIIHRDLKPDNIFLTEVGGDKDWVKVLDFGVAKLADSEGAGTLTQTGMIFGTPKYMSPEQAEGRPIDYRADIYALGVVLYELLVGRPPFVADTPVGLLLKHISEPPAPFARVRPDLQVDPRIEAIVMKALEKRPERRQQMVSELANELEQFERASTGPVMLPGSGIFPQPAVGGAIPTEVVPGQNGLSVTPAGLQPPNAIPTNLSLGSMPMAQATGATAAAQGQFRPMDALPTAAQGAVGPSLHMTAQGLTHPVSAPGSGFETLGGLNREISVGVGSQPSPKKSPLLFAGMGLVVVAVGIVGFLALQQRDPQAVQLADPQTVAAVVATPPPVSPPVTPPPPVAPPPETPPPATDPRPPPVSPPVGQPNNVRNRPPPVTPPPPVAPAATVRLSFDSEPAGVVVKLDDKQVGITPFFGDYARDDILTFTFEHVGYESARRTVNASRDQRVSASLVKRVQDTPPPVTPPITKRCPDGSRPPCIEPVKKPPPDDSLGGKVDDLR